MTRFARETLWTGTPSRAIVTRVSDTEQKSGSDRRPLTAAETELLERVRARRVLPPAAERQRIRKAAGISQRELGEALGVSWMAINRWEAGSKPREHKHELAYADMLAALSRVIAQTPAAG
jgi:DNA-binding XRE family transcriptional regulator